MTDLPKDRLTPALPFTYIGLDYFGPFTTKQGRKEQKGMEHCSHALLAELFTSKSQTRLKQTVLDR